MTDTTDIAALRNKFGTKLPTADDAKEKFIELLNGPHAYSWFLSPYVVALLDAFEAERQRANESGERFYKAVQYGAKLEAEIAALKCKLANPVVLPTPFCAVTDYVYDAEATQEAINAAGFTTAKGA